MYAGKFRRYHGEGWRQLLDIETQAHNLWDGCLVLVGVWQSFWLMHRLKPRVVFSKGSFVSVPVALGGLLNGVPYITHDSDSTPGLANRIIARWAALHAVALPEELYPYPRDKTITVGVPVGDSYRPVTQKLQQQYRHELGLEHYKRMLFITGGGNGADSLNKAVARNVPLLLRRHPELVIVHAAGRALAEGLAREYDSLLKEGGREKVVVKDFVTDLYRYSGAADIVIARAGATGLAEFAQQARACVIVPTPHLAWQIHHAKTLASRGAIVQLSEAEAARGERLGNLVADLLDDDERRRHLGENLAQFARPDAAKQLAVLLLEQAKEG